MLPRTICRMEQRPLDISPPCAKPLGSFQGVSAACFLRGTGGESQIRQWPTLGKCWLSGTLDYLESKSQSTNDELCNLEQTTPSTRPTRQRGGEREILKALCKFKLVTQVSKRVSSPLHRRGKSKSPCGTTFWPATMISLQPKDELFYLLNIGKPRWPQCETRVPGPNELFLIIKIVVKEDINI